MDIQRIKDQFRHALLVENARLLGDAVDRLRTYLKWTWLDCATYAQELGVDADTFDGLLYEADMLEGEGR